MKMINSSNPNYVILEYLSLTHVIPYIPDMPDRKIKQEFEGYNLKVGSLRMSNFKRSHICYYCGLRGTHFEINDFLTKKGEVVGKPHLNMWAIDVLMTHDHVLPKSHHGKDNMDNTVTCCTECNNQKGSLLIPSLLNNPINRPSRKFAM